MVVRSVGNKVFATIMSKIKPIRNIMVVVPGTMGVCDRVNLYNNGCSVEKCGIYGRGKTKTDIAKYAHESTYIFYLHYAGFKNAKKTTFKKDIKFIILWISYFSNPPN